MYTLMLDNLYSCAEQVERLFSRSSTLGTISPLEPPVYLVLPSYVQV